MADKEYNPFWDAEKWKDTWKKEDKSIWETIGPQLFPPFVIEPGNLMPTCKIVSTSMTGVSASFIGFYFPWTIVHLAGGALCDHTWGEKAKKQAAEQNLAIAATQIAQTNLASSVAASKQEITRLKADCVGTLRSTCSTLLNQLRNHAV